MFSRTLGLLTVPSIKAHTPENALSAAGDDVADGAGTLLHHVGDDLGGLGGVGEQGGAVVEDDVAGGEASGKSLLNDVDEGVVGAAGDHAGEGQAAEVGLALLGDGGEGLRNGGGEGDRGGSGHDGGDDGEDLHFG